jgi:type II secretory pathway pseudopilin PulG
MLHNNKGFGLVETIVAAGIVGGMAVVIANMTETNQKI